MARGESSAVTENDVRVQFREESFFGQMLPKRLDNGRRGNRRSSKILRFVQEIGRSDGLEGGFVNGVGIDEIEGVVEAVHEFPGVDDGIRRQCEVGIRRVRRLRAVGMILGRESGGIRLGAVDEKKRTVGG